MDRGLLTKMVEIIDRDFSDESVMTAGDLKDIISQAIKTAEDPTKKVPERTPLQTSLFAIHKHDRDSSRVMYLEYELVGALIVERDRLEKEYIDTKGSDKMERLGKLNLLREMITFFSHKV